MAGIHRTEEIRSHQDFIAFLHSLKEDFAKNGESWENNRLDSFLAALTAYADDISGYHKNTAQQTDLERPTWKVFADVLLGATKYE